jgi:hypothetical protein
MANNMGFESDAEWCMTVTACKGQWTYVLATSATVQVDPLEIRDDVKMRKVQPSIIATTIPKQAFYQKCHDTATSAPDAAGQIGCTAKQRPLHHRLAYQCTTNETR